MRLGPRGRRSAVALQREFDRFLLLGGELELSAALAHLLGVYPRLVAMVNRREHEPRPGRVEQRDRRRLATGHFAVRVIADQRVVGDPGVESLLRDAHPLVEPPRHVLEILVQRFELGLQSGGVGDQILAASYTVNGDAFVADKPRVWLAKPGGTDFDLSPDGKRLAVVTPVASAEGPKAEHEVVFLTNFFDELRRRVALSK